MDYEMFCEGFRQLTLWEVLGENEKIRKMLPGVPDEVIEAFLERLNTSDFRMNFFSESDMVTDQLFEKVNGSDEVVYSLSPRAKVAGTRYRTGVIGDQTSQWHLENLRTHTAFVIGRAHEIWSEVSGSKFFLPVINEEEEKKKTEEEKRKEEAERIFKPIVVCAFLHDAGKKYCALTNERGEISSPGHAECSAVIAKWWLRDLPFISSETRRAIVAAIYAHDLIKRWSKDSFRLKTYHRVLGDLLGSRENRMAKIYAEILADADAGVKKVIRDDRGEEVEYEISWYHFDKNTGEVNEILEKLSNDEFARIVNEGIHLLETIFPQEETKTTATD